MHLMAFVLLVATLMRATSHTIGQYMELFNGDYKTQAENRDQMDYSFGYYVDNPETGVVLDHWEGRQGDHVTGRYGLVEPSGFVRTVHYEVVGNSGFKTYIKTRPSASRQHQFRLSGGVQPLKPYQHLQPVAFVI